MFLPTLLVVLGAAVIAVLFTRTSNFLLLYLRPSTLQRYQHSSSSNSKPISTSTSLSTTVSSSNLSNNTEKAYALITGSTDGIGLGYAEELATKGFNLILHGRNINKLNTVKSTLQKTYPDIIIRTWLYDAKNISTIPLEKTELSSLLQDINLTILVNNAGIGFEAQTHAEINAHLDVNIRFPTHLTHFLLPTLLSNTPSLILFTGSDSDLGMPYISHYSGTKAYLASYSSGLAQTFQDQNQDVEVMTLRMQTVAAGENKGLGVSFFRPGAREMARMCLDRVGCGKRVVSAYWVHAIVRGLIESVPEAVKEWIVAGALRERRKGWDKDM